MDDTQSLLNEPGPEDAAEAFARLEARVAGLEERLDGRLALMTRTLEHIAIERQSLDVPDYSPTLAKMNSYLASIAGQTRAMQETPALKLTPKSMAAEMATAAQAARDTDKATIAKAQDLHRQAHADLMRAIGHVRGKVGQRWHMAWCIGGTAMVVSLLWLVYPGWAAAIGPRNWLWPERVAQRVLGEPSLWDAGRRMMQAGDSESWQDVVAATELQRDNRDKIENCQRAAQKTGKPVQCSIAIGERR